MKYEVALDRHCVKVVNNDQQDKTSLGYSTGLLKILKIPCISHCLGIILYSSIMKFFFFKKKYLSLHNNAGTK